MVGVHQKDVLRFDIGVVHRESGQGEQGKSQCKDQQKRAETIFFHGKPRNNVVL